MEISNSLLLNWGKSGTYRWIYLPCSYTQTAIFNCNVEDVKDNRSVVCTRIPESNLSSIFIDCTYINSNGVIVTQVSMSVLFITIGY